MKKLLTLSLITLSLNASANVVCEKSDNGRWYPKNDTSKQIAELLGVKTCTGKRFRNVVKKMGYKSNVAASKKNLSVEETIKALQKK